MKCPAPLQRNLVPLVPCSNQLSGSITGDFQITGSHLINVKALHGVKSRHLGSCHCKSAPTHSSAFNLVRQAFIYCQLDSDQVTDPLAMLPRVPYLNFFFPDKTEDPASSCLFSLTSILISSFLPSSICSTGSVLHLLS